MKYCTVFIFLFCLLSCQQKQAQPSPSWTAYDETQELAANATHPSPRMQYQLIQSKYLDKNELWRSAHEQIKYFTEVDYQALMPYIYEQNIPTLQEHIQSGKLSYEQLTSWYIYRMLQFENDKEKTLHTILAINPEAVKLAKERDLQKSKNDHPLYGMPILLKDNINTVKMKTTAGAAVLKDNQPRSDAFIVDRIQAKGGIILGKVNLSEWAYFLCSGCPLGYSAVGGQTLNPYGRKQFETGGSSAGSATSMAANYAAAAVGTETSGSILSPSSLNSIVGLKPTIGLLSRSGIVPISSTLDTPGPMTRSVIDNAILLSAMTGKDAKDATTIKSPDSTDYWEDLASAKLEGLRLGVNKAFLEDSIYQLTIEKIKSLGAELIEFEAPKMDFEGFVTLLNADMKIDLPQYLKEHASANIKVKNVADIVQYNLRDTTLNIPYGQSLFEGIVAENINEEDFVALKKRFHQDGIKFFETSMQKHQLDAILSINNWNAGHAAMAKYPCLTVPMGYKSDGEPISLTFIARPFEEYKLLKMGHAFEQATKAREVAKGY